MDLERLDKYLWMAIKVFLFSLGFSVVLTTAKYQFGRVDYQEACMGLSKILAVHAIIGTLICVVFLVLCAIFGDWCGGCHTETGRGEQHRRSEESSSDASSTWSWETLSPPRPKAVRSEPNTSTRSSASRIPLYKSSNLSEPTLRDRPIQRPIQLVAPELFDQFDRPGPSEDILQPRRRGVGDQSGQIQAVIPPASRIISKPACSGPNQHCLGTPTAAREELDVLGALIIFSTVALTGFMIYRFIGCHSKPAKVVLAVAAATDCVNKAKPKQ